VTDATINYRDTPIKFYDLLDTGYNMDKFIREGSLYTRGDHQFQSLIPHIPKEGVVYDIGAYIGTFSIPMALEGFDVIAFEGFPSNSKRAAKNCVAYPSIDVHNVAVSNKTYEVETKFNDCTDQGERKEALIKYVELDNYVKENNIPNPDFIKLDIEGMETIALFGMKNMIKNVKPIWQICYHADHPEKHEHYPGFVKTQDGGFDFSTLFEDYNISLEGTPVTSFSRWGEYLLVPKNES
jgi:FkbM family methyltransferase